MAPFMATLVVGITLPDTRLRSLFPRRVSSDPLDDLPGDLAAREKLQVIVAGGNEL